MVLEAAKNGRTEAVVTFILGYYGHHTHNTYYRNHNARYCHQG